MSNVSPWMNALERIVRAGRYDATMAEQSDAWLVGFAEHLDYNPDQPRSENGQFGEGGGGAHVQDRTPSGERSAAAHAMDFAGNAQARGMDAKDALKEARYGDVAAHAATAKELAGKAREAATNARDEHKAVAEAAAQRAEAAAKEAAKAAATAKKLEAGGKKNYEQAKAEHLRNLAAKGWKTSSTTLKVPHATSPNGQTRLYFKPQAVHISSGGGQHDLSTASSLFHDTREGTTEDLIAAADRASSRDSRRGAPWE